MVRFLNIVLFIFVISAVLLAGCKQTIIKDVTGANTYCESNKDCVCYSYGSVDQIIGNKEGICNLSIYRCQECNMFVP